MSGAFAQPGETKELRLAVVCYGGVSLAIYMHGTTKELHRLVKASALLDRDARDDDYQPSERVYRDLLLELTEKHPEKVRTRAVVDIVAGTSAGGINGVYLAKAVAHNRSQDALRNLWLDKGDIGKIMHGWSRIPWWARAPWLLARARRKAPLHGDSMSVWLYEALEDMDKERTPADVLSLMPPGHLLQLYVTTTDFYGYNRSITLADPDAEPDEEAPSVFDRRHRHVLEFRHGNGRDDFKSAEDNVALAFSARATSSFPGAFQPVSFQGFLGYLGEREARFPDDFAARYFRHYGLSQTPVEGTFFVDGGVLDNRPFGHAIAAIKAKPSSAEVDRRLLYLEPDPGSPAGREEPPDEPGTIANALGALSGIPRKEPILDDLLAVSVLNERVRRVRDIIEDSFEAIDAKVRELLKEVSGRELEELPLDPSDAKIQEWRDRVNEEAAQSAGFGHATYVRMKISGIVDRYARTVCEITNFPADTDQAFFVRSVLRSWARNRLLFAKCADPTHEQLEFIQNFDLEYSQRRLGFVLAGLNWYYRDLGDPNAVGVPPREELDKVKVRLSEAVELLEHAMTGRGREQEITDRLLACFAEDPVRTYTAREGFAPKGYAEEHRHELDQLGAAVQSFLARTLKDFNLDLYRDLNRLMSEWNAKRRTDLFVRYLGFAFWDILLYPVQALADVGERDHVQVVRMSPRDSSLLSTMGEAKLAGIGRGHFGAFFDRPGREKDYLWGRLDAAERLIGILLEPSREQDEFERWCTRAFEAIVAEEADALPEAKDVVEHTRTWLAEHRVAQPVPA
jgi:patatin-related protein